METASTIVNPPASSAPSSRTLSQEPSPQDQGSSPERPFLATHPGDTHCYFQYSGKDQLSQYDEYIVGFRKTTAEERRSVLEYIRDKEQDWLYDGEPCEPTSAVQKEYQEWLDGRGVRLWKADEHSAVEQSVPATEMEGALISSGPPAEKPGLSADQTGSIDDDVDIEEGGSEYWDENEDLVLEIGAQRERDRVEKLCRKPFHPPSEEMNRAFAEYLKQNGLGNWEGEHVHVNEEQKKAEKTAPEIKVDPDVLEQYQHEMLYHSSQCFGALDGEAEEDLGDDEFARRKLRKRETRSKCDKCVDAKDLEMQVSALTDLPLIDVWEAIGKAYTREELWEMDRKYRETKQQQAVMEDSDWPPIVQALCDGGSSGYVRTQKDDEEMEKAALMPLPDDNDA